MNMLYAHAEANRLPEIATIWYFQITHCTMVWLSQKVSTGHTGINLAPDIITHSPGTIQGKWMDGKRGKECSPGRWLLGNSCNSWEGFAVTHLPDTKVQNNRSRLLGEVMLQHPAVQLQPVQVSPGERRERESCEPSACIEVGGAPKDEAKCMLFALGPCVLFETRTANV